MDVEAEIRDLRRWVGELEGGWGVLTSQIRDEHRDLLGFQAETEERFDKVDARLNRIEGEVSSLKSDVGGLDSGLAGLKANFSSLREDMPGIVADALRDVLGNRPI